MIPKSVILSARKKDPEAIERIYVEFKDFVWNVALKTSGNQILAEDITSEVFIGLFKKIGKFKFRSSFKTWIYRVTVNAALNFMDKENRKRTKHLNEDYRDLQDMDSRIERKLDEKDMAERLLSRLDSKQRMLVVLRELEGLSYDEISQILNMNLGTVKTNIYRARDRLREIYKEIGGK